MQATKSWDKVRFIGLKGGYNTAILDRGVMVMYSIRYIHGHVQVYDVSGKFLFSADNEHEARKELMEYEEFAS